MGTMVECDLCRLCRLPVGIRRWRGVFMARQLFVFVEIRNGDRANIQHLTRPQDIQLSSTLGVNVFDTNCVGVIRGELY